MNTPQLFPIPAPYAIGVWLDYAGYDSDRLPDTYHLGWVGAIQDSKGDVYPAEFYGGTIFAKGSRFTDHSDYKGLDAVKFYLIPHPSQL